MRFSTSVLGLAAWSLLAVSSVADEAGPGHDLMGCGAEPSEELLAIADRMRLEEFEKAFDKSAEEDVVIETHLRVVAATQQEMDTITDKALKDQIDVLNQAYNPFGFSFRLSDIARDVSPHFASTEYYPQDIYTWHYRKGGYNALNVYFMTDLSRGSSDMMLGYAQFPKDATPGTREFRRDGVAVLSATIPGGSLEGYNTGKILVHEAGHWLGLFHTFQDGCEGGDHVDDTPAQKTASPGDCVSDRDTCPNKPGKDPVHNHMDYSSEECRTEFTPGQSTRMHNMWTKFRAGK